jgi:thiamine pyrophosphokinase
MSSHHIVKDNQEPALVIADGEACSSDLLGQLLEWSPHVVVLDGALERVKRLGVKVDVVLGDFDGRSTDDVQRAAGKDVKVVHTPDQDKTDLEKAIDYLFEHSFNMVNIVWATGRRMDHTFNNICTLAKHPGKSIVIYDDYSRIFLLPKQYQKHYPEGAILSIFPIGIVKDIQTSGLKYNLRKEDLNLTERTSSSNSSVGGMVDISHGEGRLILMESHE